jgi:uncharacterized protein
MRPSRPARSRAVKVPPSARQMTDLYLLGLAAAHGGRFVSFDRALASSAVPTASAENLVVL